jgi:hypothetical protein
MSEERFAEILNELQARGDKAKLMQSLWSLTGICTGFVLPYYFSSRSDSDYSREAVSPPTRTSEPEVKRSYRYGPGQPAGTLRDSGQTTR